MVSIVRHDDDSGKRIITTKRLVLRAAKEADADPMLEVFGDAQVMEYWSELPHKSIDRTREFLSVMIQAPQNGRTDFIITIKDEDQVIGKMGIWQHDEIGFILASKHWRKGFAREALTALLPYFFVEKGYTNITADVDPDNLACLTLLKSFGFEQTGFEKKTFQLGEKWVGSVYLSLKKPKWESLVQTVPAGSESEAALEMQRNAHKE